jgi:phosphoesterase RecJ-like protein
MSGKLEVIYDYKVAIISLSMEELAKYHYKKGVTDSLANLILSKRNENCYCFRGT